MAIQSVQMNNVQSDSQKTRVIKPYREAEGVVKTKKRIKPLPPKGHLVDDNLASGVKYFFKDIGYDMKSLKNGIKGTANDHQLGRLNDVGLRLGGVAIATYLASRTTNPKIRLMEYIGLAMFLTSMSIYPKIAINTPARIMHGYDIDKEYIDDQGRKKSVQQDSNYVPYDMYIGANKGEDLDSIGDEMGIPRDIKNRHDVIREQMRKIATQNNTLWMLTAGFATPLMTALLCSGIEKFIVTPGLEKARNTKYNSQIKNMLEEVSKMSGEANENMLSYSINTILTRYEGKALPQEEYEKIVELLTNETDSILAKGIKTDINEILNQSRVITINDKTLTSMFENGKNSIKGRQTDFIFKNIIPSRSEIETIIIEKSGNSTAKLKEGITLTQEQFNEVLMEILNRANNKIETLEGPAAEHKEFLRTNLIRFKNSFITQPKAIISKESREQAVEFAKIIGEFKEKAEILDKCENFKFEHAPETVLANHYTKFQKAFVKELGILPKDFKRMSNDKEYTKKILDEKFQALCQDEAKYKNAMEKLGKIISEMEVSLHGKEESGSQIKDLINGIMGIYSKTSERLSLKGIGKVTAESLTHGTPESISTKEALYSILDGIVPNPHIEVSPNDINIMKEITNGKGSSMNLKISRLISRYQGEENSFFRILHALDFYKRAENIEELMKLSSVNDKNYVENIVKEIKEAFLNGSISDFIMKHGIENSFEYKDFYNLGWTLEAENAGEVIQKGVLTDSAKESLSKNKPGNILERLQTYITRFKNIIANDPTDFTRPEHILDKNISKKYTDMAKNNEAKFNLVAQSPVDMIQKGAGTMHADRMWLKTVGIITGAIFGVTLLAQFGFGKLKNKQNLQKIETTNNNEKKKQVKNEPNK